LVNGRKIFRANRHKKKAGIAILVSDEMASNQNKSQEMGENIRRQYGKRLHIIKENIHQKDIPVLNICSSSTRFIKERLLQRKSQTDPHTLIVADFSTKLSPVERSSRQNIEMLGLTNTINKMDLTDIYRTFLLNTYLLLYVSWNPHPEEQY
jgi:poly-beta-hydroxyalkanoate depolymerase